MGNCRKNLKYAVKRKRILHRRGGSRIFFRRGCTRPLLYFNTNKPHSFFFGRIPVVLEHRRSSQGGRGGAPLHPPPRSAPAPKVHQPFTTCEKCYGFVDDFANKRLYTIVGASLIFFVLVFRKKCLSYLLERRSVSPMPE